MKLRKQLFLQGFVVLMLAGLLLAACAPGAAVGPLTPTQTAPVVDAPAPTSRPANTPTASAPNTPSAGQPAAVAPAVAELAKQLNITVSQIKLVSAETVEWPDACLGVQKPDEMCAQMITPGFKLMLESGGKTYEVHTNQDGSDIRFVADPSQTSQPAQTLPAAALAAKQELANQLGISADTIQVATVEPVDWPDSCLGVQVPGIMCSMVVTAGYRVVLDANGQQYEYHTNKTGETVVFAPPAGEPPTPDKPLMWEKTENGVCSRVEVSAQSVAYGPCGGTLQQTQLSGGRAAELAYLTSTYQSFTALTKAGIVQFFGQGQTAPTPAEERSAAEWANLVFMEAQGGRSGAAWGLAFSWHREGGIAGFCDDLGVYLNGWAMPTSCKSGQAQAFKEYRLTADELAQMYAWIDQFANFDYDHKDAATADAMEVKMAFQGTGTEQATAEQQDQIAAFAGQIYANAVKK